MIKQFENFKVKKMIETYVNLSNLIGHTNVQRNFGEIVKLNHPIFENHPKKNKLEFVHKYDDFFQISLGNTKYRYTVDEALCDLYGCELVGDMKGLVVNNKWTIFNKINTNNSLVSYTINFLNAYVLDEQIEVNENNLNIILPPLIEEYKIDLYGNELFMNGALLILLSINRKDILATKLIIEFLTKNNCSNFEEGGLGKKSDMVGGIDLTYTTERGGIKNAQIKNFRKCELIGDFYHVSGTAAPKKYTDEIDFYFFYRLDYDELKELYIFKNKDVKLVEISKNKYEYVFPKENNVYSK